MKKSILSIILISVLLVGLTGCSSNSEKKDNSSKEKQEITENVEASKTTMESGIKKMEININNENFEVKDATKINDMYQKLSELKYEKIEDMSLRDGVAIYFYDENDNSLKSYYICENYLNLDGVPDTYKITSTNFDYEKFVEEVKDLKR